MIDLKKDVSLVPFFERLKALEKTVEGNKVNYKGIEIEVLEFALMAFVNFRSELSFEHKKNIVSKSIARIVLNNQFNSKALLKSLNDCYSEVVTKIKVKYYLLVSLSIENLEIRNLQLNDCIINSFDEFPEKFRITRDFFIDKHKYQREPLNYSKYVIEVEEKDIYLAFKKGFESLEIFRGFLCLFFNPALKRSYGIKKSSSFNVVKYSQYFTLHSENGGLADEQSIWVETDFDEIEIKKVDPSDVNIAEFREMILYKKIHCLSKCQKEHKELIHSALRNFVYAFDERKSDLTFINGWTVLENLTNTYKNDILITRATALFREKEKPLIQLQFQALKQYRNEFVHQLSNEVDFELANFLIQKMISLLIMDFHLKNPGLFRNGEDAGFCLDQMSSELDKLNDYSKTTSKQTEIINKVIELKQKLNSLPS